MTITERTKKVGYAYPTSLTAKYCRMAKTGCYFVEVGDDMTSTATHKAARGFATMEAAFEYAETLAEPYDFFSLRPDGSERWLERLRAAV